LEGKLLKETEKPFHPSGHAFVCLDSIESALACVEYFKAGPREYCHYVADTVKAFCCCCLARPQSRVEEGRSRSNLSFTRDDFNEATLEEIYENKILVMNKAVDASEIIWKNMTGVRGLFIIRRVVFFLLGLCVILFGTTPTVILGEFNWLIENFDLKNYDETYTLVIKYLQPALVIAVNQLLLLLIDLSSQKECHETHSLY
jgi:hypothetical protein